MAYGESNVYLTDDVTWSQKVKAVTPIYMELIIFVISLENIIGDALVERFPSTIYTVFSKKTPTHIFFLISMSDV